jgi:hypothetical protein
MPGSLSNPFSNATLNRIFAGVDDGLGANLFIRLYTAAPNEDGTGGAEVGAGLGYSPYQVARSAANWAEASAGANQGRIVNEVDFDIGQATGDWGTIVAAAIWTAAAGGTMVALDPALTTPKPVTNGDPVTIEAGQAIFTLT